MSIGPPSGSELFVGEIIAGSLAAIIAVVVLFILWGAWCYWVSVRRCNVCGLHHLRDRRRYRVTSRSID